MGFKRSLRNAGNIGMWVKDFLRSVQLVDRFLCWMLLLGW